MTSIATEVSAVCIFSPHAVTVLRSPELTLQCIQNVFLHFAIVTSSLLVFDIVVHSVVHSFSPAFISMNCGKRFF